MGKFDISKLPFDHIGVVVKDIDKAVEHFKSLGIGPFEELKGSPLKERIGFSSVDDIKLKIMIAPLGPVKLEVIQPSKGESVHQKFLDEKGEGLQHLCYHTDDLEGDHAKLTDMGYKMIHGARFENGGGSYYYDTDRVGGITVEISTE